MKRVLAAAVAIVALIVVSVAPAGAATPPMVDRVAPVVYDSFENPPTLNPVREGFEATSTSEFGDEIQLAGHLRALTAVEVTMSNWALHSDYPNLPDGGFTQPITLNIYAVDNSGASPAVGAKLASVTQNFLVPWRPERDPSCGENDNAWRGSDGQCYHGLGFTVTFDLTGSNLIVPSQVIISVAYNTAHHGYQPTGVPGPYDSLNVGVFDGGPTVGNDPDPGAVFVNSTWDQMYGPDGTSGEFSRGDGPDFSTDGYIPTFRVFAALAIPGPGSAAQCANGGWQSFSNPSFHSQSQCAAYAQFHTWILSPYTCGLSFGTNAEYNPATCFGSRGAGGLFSR